MEKALCRNFDLGAGICYGHLTPIPMTGILMASGSTVQCNELNAGKIYDIVIGYCGHIGIMVSGSDSVSIEELAAVRVGDAFAGTFVGVLVTSSGNINCG